MRPLLPIDYTHVHAGVTFYFRQIPTAQGLLLQELLFDALRASIKEGVQPELRQMARMYAVLVALSWDAQGPHGALEVQAPPLAEWTGERLAAFGEAVLDELSDAGLTLEDLQALGLAIRPRLLGRPPLSEASDTADFSEARKDGAPSSPATSG